MPDLDVTKDTLTGLRFRVPDGPISADLGDGPAAFVYLVPDQVNTTEVIFTAADYEPQPAGYPISIEDLRDDIPGLGWTRQLSGKLRPDEPRPSWVLLADALARKWLENDSPASQITADGRSNGTDPAAG